MRHRLLGLLHPTGWRDLRALRPGESPKTGSFDVTDLDGVDAFAAHYHDRNLYVGVAPRVTAHGRDLTACGPLHALFADQDYKDSSPAVARARLAEFPLAPSAVVDSGGGLQPYWFLTEPLDTARAKPLLRALSTGWGAAARKRPRVATARYVEFQNTPPRRVVVEVFSDQRYTVDTVVALLPRPRHLTRPTRCRTKSPPAAGTTPSSRQAAGCVVSASTRPRNRGRATRHERATVPSPLGRRRA